MHAKKTEGTVFCNLIAKVIPHYFSYILFLGSEWPGSAHTYWEEITQGGGDWGPPAVHHGFPINFYAAHFPALPHLNPPSILEFNNMLGNSKRGKCRGIADLTIILSFFLWAGGFL